MWSPQMTDVKNVLESLSATLDSDEFIHKLLKSRRGGGGGGGQDEGGVEGAILDGAKEIFVALEGMLRGKFKTGLAELYTDGMDGESVWAQVDMMNGGVVRDMKRVLRSLKKIDEDKDRGKGAILFRGGEDGDSIGDENDSTEEEEEEEDVAERARRRMERAMVDMQGDRGAELSISDEERGRFEDGAQEEEDEDEEEVMREGRSGESEENDGDPMGNPMRDGFFDVNDLESFADEEEELHYGIEYDLYGETTKGGKERNDYDSDEENYGGASVSSRRRKFRKDDEIEALAKLYHNGDKDEDDDDDEEVTAEEFFGKPDLRTIERYKSNSLSKSTAPTLQKGKDTKPSDTSSQNLSSSSSGHKAKATKLLKQTQDMEEEALAEKPWVMTGEVSGAARPLDSLLQAAPEFEQASKLAPAITVEHTGNLEDMIKRRILADDWDDVIPRELPSIRERRGAGSDAPEVSQEKSKLGLGELYERDYLKKAVGYDVEASEKETAEDAAKAEMKALFAKLCSRLDALSNYHFSPRPVEEEVEVKNLSKPAIAMEEVMPLTVSDARESAPEEVFSGKRGRESILRGETELEQNDRKRLRATKKQARRKERKQRNADEKLISRLKPGLGLNNPYEARKLKEDLSKARSMGTIAEAKQDANSDYNTSTQFFARMQQQAAHDVKGDAANNEPADYSKKRRGKGNKASELLL